jgi:hypothetical protein
MSRPTYNKEYPVPFAFDENGNVSKRIMYRFQIENGKRIRWCIAYQILEPGTGRLKDIVRYDDYGGFLHRHSAGFPPGKDHIRITVPPGRTESEYIQADILNNANLYEADAVRYGYEVSDEEDNDAV